MKAVSGKTTMPVAVSGWCIFASAESGYLNDMELGIETLSGMILERGVVALGCKIFLRL